jgi:hypothetical protein
MEELKKLNYHERTWFIAMMKVMFEIVITIIFYF